MNLFKWVHNEIRHDGSNSTPDPENSHCILDYYYKSGVGVNYVYMAIVFNEVCLSKGFKSRVIQGNARKYIFNGDWHAFNAVYLTPLNKWIFMDPSNLAYFTDEKNTPLSIFELREFLISDKTLKLNSEANHNGFRINLDDYMNYLAKNIYRFSCSLESIVGAYGIFHLTRVDGDYVHPGPLNKQQESLSRGNNTFTSNPEYFWANPF